MIAFIEGLVRFKRKDSLLIDVHQVGYEVFVTNPEKFNKDEMVFLFTYQKFAEDSQTLYGFEHEEELALFKRLINVKGVGVKIALNALKAYNYNELSSAINNADVAALKKISGIGARSASQIILDLQGKIVNEITLQPDNWEQAREALMSLGYKPADLAGLDKELDASQYALDELIRKSLQILASRKGMRF